MALCPNPRTSNCLVAQTVTVTVNWALVQGQAGFGAAGVTQSGTTTYTMVIPAGNVPQGMANVVDTLDNGTKGGNAFITAA